MIEVAEENKIIDI